jgi:hypothetical protein
MSLKRSYILEFLAITLQRYVGEILFRETVISRGFQDANMSHRSQDITAHSSPRYHVFCLPSSTVPISATGRYKHLKQHQKSKVPFTAANLGCWPSKFVLYPLAGILTTVHKRTRAAVFQQGVSAVFQRCISSIRLQWKLAVVVHG